MSFTFANLPGVQVVTVDGGLAAVNTPTTQAILVFGTSAIGPANSTYQVVSVAQAAQVFGLNGTLVRGMSEVAAYCDNIFLFRMGTNQGKITFGASGSGTQTIGTVAYAFSNAAGTLYTYGVNLSATNLVTPTGPVPPDVIPGSLITTTGFTDSDFNVSGASITSVDRIHNLITVTVPAAIPSGIVVPLTATGTAVVVNHIATVTFTQVETQIINVGDLITVASATNSNLDVTSTPVLSASLSGGIWTVTYAVSGTTPASPTAETTATLDDLSSLTATVNGTGTVAVAASSGITITLGEVAATANTDYHLWYSEGLFSLWLNNVIVLSNDPSVNVNTGDSEYTGSATGGTAINNGVSGNPDTLANAITLQAAAALSPITPDLAPVYVAPLTGIGMTSRQTYIAQQNAMNLVQGLPIDIAVTPNVYADNPNVAYYVSATPSSATNNPQTNPNALDWLWTGVDVNGDAVYQWATEGVFWNSDNQNAGASITLLGGTPVTAVAHISPVFTSATTRLEAGVGTENYQPEGFHEVNFAYQLSRFCAAQSEAPQADNGGCFGFIGCNGPAVLTNFSLPAVQKWIGFLPTYEVNGAGVTVPATSGNGLLGIPFLVGSTSSILNQACADFANGYRLPGLFQTDSGEYDGGPETDQNGYPVQLGAYLAVQGDWVLQSNGFGTYVGNIAGVIAGLVSSLDQLKAVTNKQVAGVQQLYRASLNQLDALTFADVNVMRFKGQGILPVALHDKTAATVISDYTLTLRQRIKFLVIQTLLTEANNFIGNGTNDGLTLTALQTALNADALNLQKRGYLSSYNFTITSTAAQQKAGQASIQISFVPADELVQLNATIGINLNG